MKIQLSDREQPVYSLLLHVGYAITDNTTVYIGSVLYRARLGERTVCGTKHADLTLKAGVCSPNTVYVVSRTVFVSVLRWGTGSEEVCSWSRGDVYPHQSWYVQHGQRQRCRDEGNMISAGAQGMLDAGLVSLCVEKLVQEDTTELKVRFA